MAQQPDEAAPSGGTAGPATRAEPAAPILAGAESVVRYLLPGAPASTPPSLPVLGGAGSAYPGSVLIGLLIVLLDVAAIGGLITAVVVTALRLRHGRRVRHRSGRRWMGLAALVAALGLLVVGDVWFLTSSSNQGRPSTAQVAGIWADSDGARLRLLPDGTFTAAGLPADANDPAGDGRPHPADGHGTWQVTSEDGTWNVLFTLTGGSQFQLAAAHFAKPGHASAAMFSYVFARYSAVNIWAFYRR
jgi:hypothetical protein